MLAVTDIAAEAIRTLTSDAQLADGGLRISAPEPEQGGPQLALAERPAADDVVVGTDGSAVFLEPAAVSMLDDMVLDVQASPVPDGGQELRFAIGPKEAPSG